MRIYKSFIVLILICFTANTHAQIWKKLSKQAERAAERALERKVAEKSRRVTEGAFDSVFNSSDELLKGKKMAAADIYQFNTMYAMQIVQKKDTTNFTYYFSEEPEILGSSFTMKPNEQVISVIDLGRNTIYSFMDLGDTRTSTAFGISPKMVKVTTNTEGVRAIPTGAEKEILGYLCQEYEVKAEDYHGTVWVTEEADISFPDGFKEITTSKSKGIDQRWMQMVNGIPLEMKMTDTSRKKPSTIHMLCTDLGPTVFSVIPSDYKSAF